MWSQCLLKPWNLLAEFPLVGIPCVKRSCVCSRRRHRGARCQYGGRTSWRTSGTSYRLIAGQVSRSTSSRPCSFWASSVSATGRPRTPTPARRSAMTTTTTPQWAVCWDSLSLPPSICSQVIYTVQQSFLESPNIFFAQFKVKFCYTYFANTQKDSFICKYINFILIIKIQKIWSVDSQENY